jgi:hypothetical protein
MSNEQTNNPNVAFSNWMQKDNEPTPDEPTSPEYQPSGMGAERRVSANSGGEVQVSPGYPLPKDPHAPHGMDADNDMNTAQEYGVNEAVDVGHGASIHQYGLVK